MYWIWQTKREQDQDISMVQAGESWRRQELDFGRGRPGPKELPSYTFTAPSTQDGDIGDSLLCGATTLVSDRLRAAITQAGVTNANWYPAKVVRAEPPLEAAVHVFNVIGAVACIDFARSDVERRASGAIRFINKLILRDDLTDAPPIFRAAEFLPVMFVVDHVKTAIEAAGVRGLRMVRPEQFRL